MNYTLYQGDCLAILPTLPAGSVDAVICDPPYGTTAHAWDSVIPFAPMWACIERVLKPTGAVVLFGSEPFSSLLRVSKIDWYKYDWVWEKTLRSGFMHAKNAPLKAHEVISVFSPGIVAHHGKTRRMTYNPEMQVGKPYTKRQGGDDRLAWGNMRRPSTQNNYIQINTGERYPTSILRFANPNHTNIHPTQKPLDLMTHLIRTYTNEGDTVLDFAMGSASTGVAALECGRKFIGIEKDQKFFELASQRMAEAGRMGHRTNDTAADLPLFAEV